MAISAVTKIVTNTTTTPTTATITHFTGGVIGDDVRDLLELNAAMTLGEGGLTLDDGMLKLCEGATPFEGLLLREGLTVGENVALGEVLALGEGGRGTG